MRPFVLALAALAASLALSGCFAPPQQAPDQPSSIQDPYSLNCSAGMFLVINRSGEYCEPPALCTANADCSYLNVDKLPPRMGKCVFGTCKAVCGSGIMRDCVN